MEEYKDRAGNNKGVFFVFRMIFCALLLGCGGLVIGYLIFGHVGGDFIEISKLLDPPQDFLQEIEETILGIRQIRQNILVSGAIGLGLGLLLGAILNKR